MTRPFFTIGHSTRPIGEFVDLVSSAEVRLVVDVRTVPRSRTNPQYNSEALAGSLSEFADRLRAYCGARGPARAEAGRAGGRECFLGEPELSQLRGLRHGRGVPIRPGALRELGHATQCAIMCAEAVWWRCHRRIIADYLIAAGEEVFHILGRNHVEQAQMTSAAALRPMGTLTYPRPGNPPP